MVDQKITSFRLVLGTNALAVIVVAEPCRLHEIDPITIRSPAGVHPASAPTLFNHLPTLSPTTFKVAAISNPIVAAMMKYVLFVESACQDDPPMNNAFPAAK